MLPYQSLILTITQKNSKIVITKQEELMYKGFLVGTIIASTVTKPILRVIPRIGEVEQFKQLLRLL